MNISLAKISLEHSIRICPMVAVTGEQAKNSRHYYPTSWIDPKNWDVLIINKEMEIIMERGRGGLYSYNFF